jgi:hypothetical protein
LSVEEESELTQLTFKLSKIDRSLGMLGSEMDLTTGDRTYVDLLLNFLSGIKDAESVTPEFRTGVMNAFQSLSSLLVTFNGSSSILIYAERIKALL